MLTQYKARQFHTPTYKKDFIKRGKIYFNHSGVFEKN